MPTPIVSDAPTNEDAARRAFSLIAALTDAASMAHNEGTLGQTLADSLSAELPLVELALESAAERRTWAGRHAALGAGRRHVVALGGGRQLVMRFARPDVDPLDGGLAQPVEAVIRASFSHVRTLARVAAHSHRALREREQFRRELAETSPAIVAESEVMRRLVRDTLPLVARSDATVLVRGETGSGKEVIARRVHALSRRARRPLLAVNCGALPESLAESTLFGHERGAFSGAISRQLGLFERAHGGTLLLDEVGELSLASQARLLRVLGSGEVTRVGSTTVVPVDVRVIAATHRSLEAMVRDGRFREDLYYRLHVVPIDVPPLRERRDDIAPLARAALMGSAERLGRPVPAIRPADLARLLAWSWPGNVRELESVMERALALDEGDVLELPGGWDAPPVPRIEGRAPERTPESVSPIVERFDDAQRRILTAALEAAGGRIYGADGAAAQLGLAPTTLQSKLRKLGLRGSR